MHGLIRIQPCKLAKSGGSLGLMQVSQYGTCIIGYVEIQWAGY